MRVLRNSWTFLTTSKLFWSLYLLKPLSFFTNTMALFFSSPFVMPTNSWSKFLQAYNNTCLYYSTSLKSLRLFTTRCVQDAGDPFLLFQVELITLTCRFCTFDKLVFKFDSRCLQFIFIIFILYFVQHGSGPISI